MQQLYLAGSRMAVSRLAFGTASLHHVGARDRDRLIGTAVDFGISHFDTSPYYGNGIGEIGLAALDRRMTVATKVGLYPPGGAHGSRLRLYANRALGRILPQVTRPQVDFSVARARRSLDDSLRRLRRERVDLLFLHEPRQELIATQEWQKWLDSERDRVGLIGVAGELPLLLPIVADGCALARVIQTRALAKDAETQALLSYGRAPHITYGHLASCKDAAAVVDAVRSAFAAEPERVMLVSTRRPERIAELSRATQSAAGSSRPRLRA